MRFHYKANDGFITLYMCVMCPNGAAESLLMALYSGSWGNILLKGVSPVLPFIVGCLCVEAKTRPASFSLRRWNSVSGLSHTCKHKHTWHQLVNLYSSLKVLHLTLNPTPTSRNNLIWTTDSFRKKLNQCYFLKRSSRKPEKRQTWTARVQHSCWWCCLSECSTDVLLLVFACLFNHQAGKSFQEAKSVLWRKHSSDLHSTFIQMAENVMDKKRHGQLS